MTKQESNFRLPPIHHMGLAVHDVDRAVEHYTGLGLGPFQVFEMEFPDFIYHGQLAPHRQKFGFSTTNPRIELLQVIEGETPNADFLKKRGEGIAHLAFIIDLPDFSEILTRLAKVGIGPIYHRLDNEKPVAYLNTDEIGGVMIELIGDHIKNSKMPDMETGRSLPPVSQIGMAVQNTHKTAEHYAKIGFGDFDVLEVELDGFVYKGKPAPHKVKLGFSKTLPQIELIESLEGDTPNSDFLKEKGEGITHLQFTLDMDEYNAILTRWAKEGFEPVFYRDEPQRSLAYVNTDRIGGIMLELMGLKNK